MIYWIGTLIAAGAASVGYFQWRTAHQRVVLDLFDRRLQVFEDLESAVKNVFSTTQVTNETWALLLNSKSRARFLFGEDVNLYIQKHIEDFAWRMTFTDQIIDDSPGERPALLKEKYEVLKRITSFAKNAEPLFSPYMKLDQKMPNAWWSF